jgi:RNA polymerase sigma-70 factor (ECF subfamily)
MLVWKNAGDDQLLAAAKNGEVEAFGELYERYARSIFRYLYAHTQDRMEAEDLTEEVFMRVWKTLPGYQERGVPFGAFLYQIARNLKVDYYRRSKFIHEEYDLDGEYSKDPAPDPSTVVHNNLAHQELLRIMGKLREDYRDVLVLRFLSGFSPEETAQLMDRSVGAVRVLQHRALAAMREVLARKQVDWHEGESGGF